MDAANLSSRDLDTSQAEAAMALLVPEIATLNLSRNRLSLVPEMPPQLRSLVEVSLAGNKLRTLDGALAALPLLEDLDLSDNMLETTAGLGAARRLRTVSLARNRVKVIDGMEALDSLVSLDLSDNCIGSWPAIRALSCTTSIIELRLEGNPVCRELQRLRQLILDTMPSVQVLDGAVMAPSSVLTGRSSCGRREGSYSALHLARSPAARRSAAVNRSSKARRGTDSDGASSTSAVVDGGTPYSASTRANREHASVDVACASSQRSDRTPVVAWQEGLRLYDTGVSSQRQRRRVKVPERRVQASCSAPPAQRPTPTKLDLIASGVPNDIPETRDPAGAVSPAREAVARLQAARDLGHHPSRTDKSSPRPRDLKPASKSRPAGTSSSPGLGSDVHASVRAIVERKRRSLFLLSEALSRLR